MVLISLQEEEEEALGVGSGARLWEWAAVGKRVVETRFGATEPFHIRCEQEEAIMMGIAAEVGLSFCLY